MKQLIATFLFVIGTVQTICRRRVNQIRPIFPIIFIILVFKFRFNLQSDLATCIVRRAHLPFSPREYYSMIAVLLSLVVTDELAFRAHVLSRVIMLYTLAKKKKRNPCQSVVCNPWYRRATWRRFARTSSLSLRPTSPFASYRPSGRAVPASGPRSRSAARLRARKTRSRLLVFTDYVSLRLPYFLDFVALVSIHSITHTDKISRTTSGSRSSRIVHCIRTNRLVPSVSHPPIERPTNLAS